MIISLHKSTEIITGSKALGSHYDETVSNNISSLQQCTDERVTFNCHANKNVISFNDRKLSPEKFAQYISPHLPSTVKVIDLLGCNLGVTTDKESFSLRFARELYKQDRYKHIRVNSITNIGLDTHAAGGVMVRLKERPSSSPRFVWRISHNQSLTAQQREYLHHLESKSKQIRATVDEAQKFLDIISGETKATESEIKKAKEDYEKFDKEFPALESYYTEIQEKIKSLETTIKDDIVNIREFIDQNQNHHVRYDDLTKLDALSPQEKSLIYWLNNQKAAIITERNGFLSSFFNRNTPSPIRLFETISSMLKEKMTLLEINDVIETWCNSVKKNKGIIDARVIQLKTQLEPLMITPHKEPFSIEKKDNKEKTTVEPSVNTSPSTEIPSSAMKK